MIGKVVKAGFFASIVGIITFYLFADFLGNQYFLKESYLSSEKIWRNPYLLTKNSTRILKYFAAFFLTNILWAYVYNLRKNLFKGSGTQKGIKFFFFFWLLTIPLHFWFWVMISYPAEILIYNVFVTHLFMFSAIGATIGKICSESK